MDVLKNSMNLFLGIYPSECQFIFCNEVAPNKFKMIFELPNRREVLDKLCLNALEKEPWLAQCGVTAVKIGDKSEIHMQSLIPRSVPTSITGADLPFTQGKMLTDSSIFHLPTACATRNTCPREVRLL